MNIAVNTRFLMPGKLEGFGVYTDELLKRMTIDHPEDNFDFYFDRRFDDKYVYAKNVNPTTLSPPARHPLLFYLWYQKVLKRRLMKTKPDVFFSPDSFMPLGLKTPSVITIHDTAYMRFPEYIGKSNLRYYQKNMPRFIEAAEHIITVSEFSKSEICHFYQTDPEKVSVVYNGVSQRFKPVSEETRKAVQNNYTGGNPFLLYVGSIHPRKNIARLIRAFGIFKSREKSDLQLLIAGRPSWDFKDVQNAIADSMCQDEIVMTGYISTDDLPQVVGSAFALTYVSLYEGFGLPLIEAMASGVPVITSSAKSTGAVMAEVAGDAAITVDPNEESEIADAIEQLWKNNEMYQDMVGKGFSRAKRYNWEEASKKTYEIITNAS